MECACVHAQFFLYAEQHRQGPASPVSMSYTGQTMSQAGE